MGTPVIRKLLLTTAVLIAALSSGARATESTPIKIGTTQALSGHYEEFGTEQLRGLQMWVADINARGSLLGRQVQLIHYDDASRNANAEAGVRKLVEVDGVDFLVGPYSSALTLKASAVAEELNVPMVASAASADEIWERGYRNIFGVDTLASNYLEGFRAARDAGASSLALLYARTPFAEEVALGLRKKAAADGMKILLDEGYPPEQLDFTAIAKRLKGVDADIILGISYLEDSIAIVKAVRAAGVKPGMLAFTVGPALREFGDRLGDQAEGVVGVVQWLRSVPLPGAQDFAYRYRKRYGHNPGVHAAIGYSTGQVIEAAVRLAGTTEHDAVREQLRTMYFRSLLGLYNTDDTGRQVGKTNYLLQWQDNQRRLVAPAQLAERDLIYPLP
jgi:branched-chain amino acid transport system substrate-binding protein